MGVANPGGVGACDCESVEKCQSRVSEGWNLQFDPLATEISC
jgi:hypothetical protein